jgi:2,5-furandicarboxylate decarboxylase 1
MPDRLPAATPPLDKDLRGFLASNHNLLSIVRKPVSIDHVGALSAQSERPILFENIIERPGFRLCDILVKYRHLQARALGVSPAEYLKTLAYRLRKPPRGFVNVKTGPVKEVILTGNDVNWMSLPIPVHSERDEHPYLTAMNIVQDPETGFYNSSHAGTNPLGPRHGVVSFATPHTLAIIGKYRKMGKRTMPIAFVVGVHPAYEIMANFSGLHMDMWGELEMVGTIMDMDVEMVPCETIPLSVPAHAEIVIEGLVEIDSHTQFGQVVAPTAYYLPKTQLLPQVTVTAITMRGDRPIYRNHQACPLTDHQVLPRLCHEAMLYNRLTEMGLAVKDVRFPTWGAALSCVIQVEAPRPGFINDALMACMGAPWLNTKMVVAVSHDTDIDDPGDVYYAMSTRCDPARDLFVVPATRGSLYDPAAAPLPDEHFPYRLVGKIGIDATIKERHRRSDFDRSFPKHWNDVRLADYV